MERSKFNFKVFSQKLMKGNSRANPYGSKSYARCSATLSKSPTRRAWKSTFPLVATQ